MLIIIPLLTPIQDDNGYAVGIQYLAEFAYYKAINPSVYEVYIFISIVGVVFVNV